MKFKSLKTRIGVEDYIVHLKNFTEDEKFLAFFEKNNIATPEDPSCIVLNGKSLSVDFFLGRSKDDEKDYLKINQMYEERIPKGFSAICQLNEVDYACFGPEAMIYLWQRYKNDLYFDPSSPNKYKPQNCDLVLICRSFEDFLKLVTNCDEDEESSEDDFDNPKIPFKDDDIEDDFKHPELFFKQSSEAIEIQLRKLALSEKGKDLLSLFKKMGLLH
ncbi:hypothetical protein [Acidovorax sp. LjRoot117]|uniref:hypothetical protein n=1 Tax=Acidovorax sp. LjRoot117 TaxID=3342255 RepID=UPI003ECE80F1